VRHFSDNLNSGNRADGRRLSDCYSVQHIRHRIIEYLVRFQRAGDDHRAL